MRITPEEREREQVLFREEREKYPHLFDRAPMTDADDVLRDIGIDVAWGARPLGYLRSMPQDFIVEEIDIAREVHTIGIAAPAGADETNAGPTVYADLVKIGASTFDIKARLAHLIGVSEQDIGFAGLKDRSALTSQRISIRNLKNPAPLESINEENFFIKNIRGGKGVISIGDLWGNRFTIVARLAAPLTSAQETEIRAKMQEIAESGFWNFFYLQRFGTPRLLAHRLGILLARGEYELTVKTFLTHTSPRELPYFMGIRKRLVPLWGDWEQILTEIDRFPYHFSLERAMIRYLAEHPADFTGALAAIPDQVKMWLYAYDSYVFNKKLSALIKTEVVPMELPLASSFSPADWEPYLDYFREDGVTFPLRAWRDFSFVRVASRLWPTLQSIEFHNAAFHDRFAVFSFSLPKGAYATSYLMNLFTLSSGLPMPNGIATNPVDAKKILATGSLDDVLQRFHIVLERYQQNTQDAVQE
ncbi:MAG: hypothetical protein A2679_00240 [Candidatus Sungbacteria bacterium RIFCSPHIGHO2_01_FULL_54_26]|nr:MAG: hypothetical protein A2679_00240 [Candidatus Sungbacteria bacterium RIFCSPHIGHO2_01_FULL_54_26]